MRRRHRRGLRGRSRSSRAARPPCLDLRWLFSSWALLLLNEVEIQNLNAKTQREKERSQRKTILELAQLLQLVYHARRSRGTRFTTHAKLLLKVSLRPFFSPLRLCVYPFWFALAKPKPPRQPQRKRRHVHQHHQ